MSTQSPGDEKAVEDIVYKLKSQGLFDQLRKECLNDVDTKPAYQNLRQRVESYVARFLSQQTWSPDLNKNQLRDSLRRQINQSGMLSSGVERIIEQVVNPKIFTIIKPKIDEIVCKHLGIDPEERQRQLEERKSRQQQIQQQQFQQQQQERLQQAPSEPQPLMSLSNSVTGPVPGYDNMPGVGNNMYTAYSPSANWHRPFGTMLNPHLNSNYQMNASFTQGYSSYGMTSPLYPYMQQGWAVPPFPGMPPMFPQQPPPLVPPGSVADVPPVISAPQFTEPPPPLPSEPYSAVEHMETVPAPPPEPEPSTSDLTPPGISPVTLPTPPPKPDMKAEKVNSAKLGEGKKEKDKPKKPETKTKVESKPADGIYNILKDIPLPIPLPGSSETGYQPGKDLKKKSNGGNDNKSKDKSSTVSQDKGKERSKDQDISKESKESEVKTENKAESDKNTSENSKYPVSVGATKSKNGAAFKNSSTPISKSSNNKSSVSQTTKSSQNVKPMKEQDKIKDSKDGKSKPVEKPITESKDSNMKDIDAKEKSNVVKSDLTSENLEKLSETQQTKQYTFSWTKGMDVDEVSSITVSSVHTSDLSSFEDDAGFESDKESNAGLTDDREIEVEKTEDVPVSTGESADVSGSQSESMEVTSPVKPAAPVQTVTAPRPKKLVSLMYNYSDSDDDETREERKARIAREKEERYAKRQQRRAELDAKRKEREEEKTRLREEQKNRQSESDMKTQSEESEATKTDTPSTDQVKSEESEDKPASAPSSPKKKTKKELKEQLREQKVLEKKLALRRQRTRNRRYTSEEFTSIFTEKRQPFSSQSYTSVEDEIEKASCVGDTEKPVSESPVKDPGSPKSPATPTQDEPCVYPVPEGTSSLPTGIPVYEITATPSTSLTIGQVVHETRSRTRKLSDERKSNETHSTGRPGSPFSDISETSKPESIGDTQERRPKRRRIDSVSPQGADGAAIRSRRGSAVSPSDCNKAAVESGDVRTKGKRYSVDDLYKPRTSHRRSPPPSISPPVTAKFQTSTRRRSSLSADRPISPPLGRLQHPPSPPPLAAPNTSKRYDAEDLYKPRQPSSRSSRYLQRQPLDPPTVREDVDKSSRETEKKGESGKDTSKRELPFAAKDFGDEDGADDLPGSSADAERKRPKRPIALVDFGEAARRTDRGPPQGDKFRGRPWANDRTRFERKGQRKYFEGGWCMSDVEKTGSRSPTSSHSSGSGQHSSRGWKDTYDSEPSLIHRSGSHSPSKFPRTKDIGDMGQGRLQADSPDHRRPPSPTGQAPPSPPSPGIRRLLSPHSPGIRRPPSPPSPGRGLRRPPSPPSPGRRRPPSPHSPGIRRPPSPPSPGIRRPPSTPSPGPRRPPSPPSPGLRRPPSPNMRCSLSPASDLGPRTRRHRPGSPESFSRGRRPPSPPTVPVRRTTRNTLYHPVMTGPRGRGWVNKGRSWGARHTQGSAQGDRYLRSRSPTGDKSNLGRRDTRRQSSGAYSSGRRGKSRRDPSPPPGKRLKR